MQELTLIIPITLKAVVTEELRAELTDEIQEGVRQLDFELQQIDFQGRRALTAVEREDLQGAIALRGRIEEEKKKRMEAKTELSKRIDEIRTLPEGAEVSRGTVQAQILVRPGTDLNALLQAELIIKNGVVTAIRAGSE